jgi:hypothetical protein
VRQWMTPRCILVVLTLVVAPCAALAHLVVVWVPGHFDVARLNLEIAYNTRELDREWEQTSELIECTKQLRQATADEQGTHDRGWLPHRDRDLVFESLADALHDDRVSIERLTIDEPGLFAAVSRSNLLACERVTVSCAGAYSCLTACLDRISALDLPVRITELSWSRNGSTLDLSLKLEIPFVPEESLRLALADAAGLSEKDDGT